MLKWLHGDKSKHIRTPIPLPSNEIIDSSWQPPSMIQAWHMTVPLELIRYAGANYLCVQIEYKNTNCLIEPYNLKRTLAGRLLLIAAQHETKECQSYYVDELCTRQKFEIAV
ncbi:MAG: hypothetical protein ACHQVK_00995, partial [Candidatus Paceibacterales bacterium]